MAVENELIRGIQLMSEGKEEGFNILYSHTYNYVYGRAKIIMKDEEDALDLTQETFVQAYKNIHTLEKPENVYAWLGAVVYKNGMKIYRKKRDVLVNEQTGHIFEEVISEDVYSRPEEKAEEEAAAQVLMSMIEELPDLQRAAILAFYYDNMKIDEIAELFECSSNTIKSRLNYAKKYLKEKVEVHEKTYAYRLHTVSPAIIVMAFKSMFASETYKIPEASVQTVYNTACAGAGITPAVVSSSAVPAAAGTVGTKTSMALGTKIAIGAAAAALATGALILGGLFGAKEEKVPNMYSDSESNETKEEKILDYTVYYDADGNVTMTTYRESNEENKTLTTTDVDPDGNETALRKYVYDENGVLEKMLTYKDGEMTLETFYENDEIVRRDYYSNGTLIQYEVYSIEESGNLRVDLYSVINGQEELRNYTIEAESEDGLAVTRTMHDMNGRMVYEFIYTYDEYGFITHMEERAAENANIIQDGENIKYYERDYVNEYDEDGNPLKTTIYDENGDIVSSFESFYKTK